MGLGNSLTRDFGIAHQVTPETCPPGAGQSRGLSIPCSPAEGPTAQGTRTTPSCLSAGWSVLPHASGVALMLGEISAGHLLTALPETPLQRPCAPDKGVSTGPEP